MAKPSISADDDVAASNAEYIRWNGKWNPELLCQSQYFQKHPEDLIWWTPWSPRQGLRQVPDTANITEEKL